MEKKTSSKAPPPPPRVVSSKFDKVQGAKEKEIAAQITLPVDGGWGWVVLGTAMMSLAILDGIVLTFGSFLHDIAKDLDVSVPSTALVGSVNYTLYLMLSPIASALINKYGFRLCAMLGSIICSISVLISSFSRDYPSFLALHGVVFGLGCSCVSMSAYLVVGFYFHKYRTYVMVIVTMGCSVGMMVVSPMNILLNSLGGWRPTLLLHSGLLGICYFLAFTYRPLVPVTVKNTEDAAKSARIVTYLPDEKDKTPGQKPIVSKTERVLGAVSNTRYPTAAAVIDEPDLAPSPTPGTSTGVRKSKLLLTSTQDITQAQFKHVQKILTTSEADHILDFKVQERKRRSCWTRLFHSNLTADQSRPLYRDDAFYDGNMDKLPQYRKSKRGDRKLDYQMRVTRVATVDDLHDKRVLCGESVRRVLATMFELALFKKPSFVIICIAGTCNYLGILVVFTYITQRNIAAGMDPDHCTYFITAIGIANAVGRAIWSVLAAKCSPSYLYSAGLLIAGGTTMLSNLSFTFFYQYLYCVLFGATLCVSNSMRALMIVDMFGLERLTNGTGVLLLFMGLGNLFSTPVGGILKVHFGYDKAFYFSGFFLFMAGALTLPVKLIRNNEIKRENIKKNLPVKLPIKESEKERKEKEAQESKV